MKTYKIKLENNKHNIYYFVDGKIESKEFYTGEVRLGYTLDIKDSVFTKADLDKLQFDEMKVYDWHFVRKIRKGVEVPIDILNELNEIDERYNALKLEIK